MSKPSDKQKPSKTIDHTAADYDNVLSRVVELLDAARRASARVVNPRWPQKLLADGICWSGG